MKETVRDRKKVSQVETMISKTDVFKSYKLREKKMTKAKKENNLIRNQFVRMSNVFAIFFFHAFLFQFH